MSLAMPTIVSYKALESLTAALTNEQIYILPGDNTKALLRITVYLKQNAGSSGVVSTSLTFHDNLSLTPSISLGSSTSDTNPIQVNVPVYQWPGDYITLSTTIDSGSPNYSVYIAAESLSLY